jgi:hypothetical protein
MAGNGDNQAVRLVSQDLRCKLTADEWANFARRSADLTNQLNDLIDESKNVAREYKAKIDKTLSEVKELAVKVSTEHEMRAVECEELLDYERARVTVTRLDTNELVSERVMTPAERQRGLSFEEAQA